ncbi:MAG: M15 family metallopeptidase [Erysipelotrichaceae bacterium]
MKKRKLKPWVVIAGILMVLILSLDRIEVFIKENTIPNYRELNKIGYNDDQIEIINEHGLEELPEILVDVYKEDIVEILTVPHYANLREIGYSKTDLETILLADETILKKLEGYAFLNRWKTYLAEPMYRLILDTGYSETAGELLLGLSDETIRNITALGYDAKYEALVTSELTILGDLPTYLTYWTKVPGATLRVVQERVNTETDRSYYTGITAAETSKGNLILVNKYFNLSSQFVPSTLTTITVCGKAVMTKEAALALSAMCKAMIEDGLHPKVTSSYRSYATQNTLYNRYVANDGKAEADTYSARPGHSEHQTGLAVDIITSTSSLSTFKNTKEYAWLMENAEDYGFILRYTESKQAITGYISEAWHWRYVGIETAKDFNAKNMTFDEYYRIYLE